MSTNEKEYTAKEAEEYVAQIDASINAYLEKIAIAEETGLVGPFDGTKRRRNKKEDR